MRRYPFLALFSAFWSLLKFAVLYFLLLTYMSSTVGHAEKLLLLFFGSPWLLLSGIFLFIYLKPQRFSNFYAFGSMALILDGIISLFVLVYRLVSNLSAVATLARDQIDGLASIILLISIAVDVVVVLIMWKARLQTSGDK